ncbi:MAG: glutathione S-transferase family protein [Deltaproteobacteria bacterium]|nr:MAG: glutathione S-transferase family protein [Deltaproteobacteria bacterium]
MKLYSGPLSLFTAKVRIALDEKSLAYERVEVGWSLAKRYEPHHPDVVALNPKRQVPVLVDGDVLVYDSTIVLEYLEDRYPEPPLYPRDPIARARCRQLEAAADELWFPAIWDLIEGVFYAAASGKGDPARVDAARAALAQRYGALDKELAGREFLCGAFSVADIGTFIMVNAAATLGAPPGDAHANVLAWLARTRARPAVRREAEAMGACAAKALAGVAAT